MLLWPSWLNAGACDEWFGRRWMVSFAARCLPKCCSSSPGLKVALAKRERRDDIYHAICFLPFLTGTSSAVWAMPAREGVEANDAIKQAKLHSTLLNIRLHMMHELYNVAMPLDLWDIKSFATTLLKPAIVRLVATEAGGECWEVSLQSWVKKEEQESTASLAAAIVETGCAIYCCRSPPIRILELLLMGATGTFLWAYSQMDTWHKSNKFWGNFPSGMPVYAVMTCWRIGQRTYLFSKFVCFCLLLVKLMGVTSWQGSVIVEWQTRTF